MMKENGKLAKPILVAGAGRNKLDLWTAAGRAALESSDQELQAAIDAARGKIPKNVVTVGDIRLAVKSAENRLESLRLLVAERVGAVVRVTPSSAPETSNDKQNGVDALLQRKRDGWVLTNVNHTLLAPGKAFETTVLLTPRQKNIAVERYADSLGVRGSADSRAPLVIIAGATGCRQQGRDEIEASDRAMDAEVRKAADAMRSSLYSPDDLREAASAAEKRLIAMGIPESKRVGAALDINQGGPVKSYKYQKIIMGAGFVREPEGWALSRVSRKTVWPGTPGSVDLYLTPEQGGIAVTNFANSLRVNGNLAPPRQPQRAPEQGVGIGG